MKRILKYTFISMVAFMFYILNVGAEENALVCQYNIDCGDFTRIVGTSYSEYGISQTSISVTKDDEGYHFNYGTKMDTQYDDFPAFCGYQATKDYPEAGLEPNNFESYFTSGDFEKNNSQCPTITFAVETDQITSPPYLTLITQSYFNKNKGNYWTEASITSDLTPVTVTPNPIETNSSSFSCYYYNGEDYTEEYSYALTFYTNSNKITFVGYSSGFHDNSVRFSKIPSSQSECPTSIYFCGVSKVDGDEDSGHYLTDGNCENGKKGAQFKNISYEEYKDPSKITSNNLGNGTNINADLSGCIIDSDTQEIIDWILNMVRFVGIILVIVLGMLDFIKATASGEQEEVKKSRGKFVKRLIACIALFLAPIIVDFLLWMINSGSTNC